MSDIDKAAILAKARIDSLLHSGATEEPWTPPGSTGEKLTAFNLAVGDLVLVNRSFGTWMTSSAEDTQRHSVWAKVIDKNVRGGYVRLAMSVNGVAIGSSLRREWHVIRQVPTAPAAPTTYAEMSPQQRRAHVVGLSNQVLIALSAHGAEMASHGRGDTDSWERAEEWEIKAKQALRELTALIPGEE